MKVTGWRKTPKGNFNFLGYGTNSAQGKFNFPKNSEFVAVKLKSNISLTIQHLAWEAPWYFHAPDRVWDDVHPSKIVTLE